jgi:hypothetical protein
MDTGDWLVLGGIALFSLATFICPIARSFYRVEIIYNEGWTLYNTLKVVHHVPLYAAKYSWTAVDYPALSFYVYAYLSRFIHNYLLMGRLLSIISLAISCVLIGWIVRKLTGNLAPAFFAGFFCLGLFCAHATKYVGMYDPQMFAQVFFLSGLLLYISTSPTLGAILAIALLFIVGGNIKHTLIQFPIAVFIDLCFVSVRRAAQFVLVSAVLLVASIVLSIKLCGPFFIANLTYPRTYSLLHGILDFLYNFGPIMLPFVIAFIWVIRNRGDDRTRLIRIFFLVSLIVGVGFGGGTGISINVNFANFFAISIVLGLILYDVGRTPSPFPNHRNLWKRGYPIVLSASLILALFLSRYFNVWNRLQLMPVEQRQFDMETSFIEARRGPALCESILRCYFAGKDYVYDPFNSTRLVLFHKLDASELVQNIAAHEYGAIQLHGPVGSLERPNELFPDAVLDAVSHYYVLGFDDPECAIYVPNENN